MSIIDFFKKKKNIKIVTDPKLLNGSVLYIATALFSLF